jgi:hypothetical protein
MKNTLLSGRFLAVLMLALLTLFSSFNTLSAQAQQASAPRPLSDAAAIALLDTGSYDPQIAYDDWMYWRSDTHFVGGRYTSNPAIQTIHGVEYESDARAYKTARVATSDLGSFAYTIPVSVPGTYTVVLDFAELYWGATNGGPDGAGRRVFSVNAEGGESEIAQLDINAEVGPMAKLTKRFDVVVTDGTLNIVFQGIVNRPLVSRIGVYLFDPPPPLDLRVETLYLVDVNTGNPMMTITNGAVIDVAQLPSNRFALQAITTPSTVGSVTFGINKNGRPYAFDVQNTAPYIYPGNFGPEISWWYAPDGAYTAKLTPYTQPRYRGIAGQSTVYEFTIINNPD